MKLAQPSCAICLTRDKRRLTAYLGRIYCVPCLARVLRRNEEDKLWRT